MANHCLTDTELYATFATVVANGSAGRAAKTLYLDRSTVFYRIRQLEARAGLVLFDRSVRGMVLTEAGRGMLERLNSEQKNWA